jgi:hypothetical protein
MFECLKARMSMVDGFPYKEEVGGSNPSVPTTRDLRISVEIENSVFLRSRSSVG